VPNIVEPSFRMPHVFTTHAAAAFAAGLERSC
jgi:hypothetical protein